MAAASIAQVHRAEVTTASGRRAVAVKVLRPGIERRFRADLDAFYFAARKAERFSAEARRLRLIEVVDTLRRSVRLEMDLRLEAAALSEMAENTKDDPDFRVPAVDWDRTANEVLTLEWIDATPLTDRAALRGQGLRPAAARPRGDPDASCATRCATASSMPTCIRAICSSTTTGELVAVDFGIMGRLGPKERRFLAEILYGFITRDYHRTAEVHFEAGYVPRHHSVEDFAQAIRAIGEPIHNRTAEDISMAKLLTLLFEVTGLFDMRTRPELLLLQKTMVVVEGVARSLDPKLDMWKTAEPVVREWVERHLGPAGAHRRRRGRRRRDRPLPRRVPALLSRGAACARSARRHHPQRARARAGNRRRHRRGGSAPQPLDHGRLWVIAALLALLVFRAFSRDGTAAFGGKEKRRRFYPHAALFI